MDNNNLKRVLYYKGQLLTAQDFRDEQDYHINRLRQLVGRFPCGIISGLNVRHEIQDNVIVTNLMDEETIYCGNRFLIYALYPEQNIEVRVMWGREKQNVVFTCGHSILNRTSNTDVSKLMLKYGGGGHRSVGTCQVTYDDWEQSLKDIVEQMRADG